jgi:hypothetical protein
MTRLTAAVLLASSLVATSLAGQTIVQSRGVDSRVDYASLTRFGPWDDRNYDLTAEDLTLLAPNEAEQIVPIPAFFRVELRREMPDLQREGVAQYPRKALNYFEQRYGGYLIDGRLYEDLTWEDGRYRVVTVLGEDYGRFVARRLLLPEFLSGEARLTNPTGGAESAVAVSPANPETVLAGTNGPGGGQKMHYSTNGGVTWTQVSLPLGGTCCDPTVEWNTAGTLAYAATLGGSCCAWVYRSGDDGVSWTDLEDQTPGDPRREFGGSSTDKEYLHVDRFPTSPCNDDVYLTWHDSNVLKFDHSADDGNTWDPTIAFSSASDYRGIGSDITSDKAGNVYYFWPAFNSKKIWVHKSTDCGASFDPNPTQVATTQDGFDFAVPSMETRRVFIYNSADVDLTDGPYANRVYVAWTDDDNAESGIPANNHARIWVAFSADGGATWNLRTPHETGDISSVDRYHEWLAVAGDGSVHVIFYDTRNDPTRQSVDLYHSFSTDGGDTWSAPERLTTVSSPNISNGFEWGDYNGLSAVMSDVIAVYTDNRNELGGGGDSVDVYAIGLQAAQIVFSDGFESGDTSAWSTAVP